MELKTIIYIIGAIIYLYSRSKKKDKNPTGQTLPEEPQESDVFDWEDTLRRFTDGNKDVPSTKQVIDNRTAEKSKQPAEFSYETTVLQTRDLDEEVIARHANRDLGKEALNRKQPRNLEEQAMKRTKVESLESDFKKVVVKNVSALDEEGATNSQIPAPFLLAKEDIRYAFICGEIFQPRYF